MIAKAYFKLDASYALSLECHLVVCGPLDYEHAFRVERRSCHVVGRHAVLLGIRRPSGVYIVLF